MARHVAMDSAAAIAQDVFGALANADPQRCNRLVIDALMGYWKE